MLHAFRIALPCCALFLAYAGPAEARRVALVIGELPLDSPPAGTTAVAEALFALLPGTATEDLRLDDFRLPVYELLRKAAAADVIGVVFHSGNEVLLCGRSAATDAGVWCATVLFTQG
jgi:hypothetical protein